MKIVWSPEAVEDLVSLRAYIAEDSPATAQRTVRLIIERIEQLLPDNPRMGRAGRRAPANFDDISETWRDDLFGHQKISTAASSIRFLNRGRSAAGATSFLRTRQSGALAPPVERHWLDRPSSIAGSTSARARNSSLSLSIKMRVASIKLSPHRSCRTRHGSQRIGLPRHRFAIPSPSHPDAFPRRVQCGRPSPTPVDRFAPTSR